MTFDLWILLDLISLIMFEEYKLWSSSLCSSLHLLSVICMIIIWETEFYFGVH